MTRSAAAGSPPARLIHGFALSGPVGAGKPDKLIFERVLGIAGCKPSQALFIGDDPVADSGALDAGIPVVLVPPAPDDADQSPLMISGWLIAARPAAAHARDAAAPASRRAGAGPPHAGGDHSASRAAAEERTWSSW